MLNEKPKDAIHGQTMFQLLKRKKKIIFEKSLGERKKRNQQKQEEKIQIQTIKNQFIKQQQETQTASFNQKQKQNIKINQQNQDQTTKHKEIVQTESKQSHSISFLKKIAPMIKHAQPKDASFVQKSIICQQIPKIESELSKQKIRNNKKYQNLQKAFSVIKQFFYHNKKGSEQFFQLLKQIEQKLNLLFRKQLKEKQKIKSDANLHLILNHIQEAWRSLIPSFDQSFVKQMEKDVKKMKNQHSHQAQTIKHLSKDIDSLKKQLETKKELLQILQQQNCLLTNDKQQLSKQIKELSYSKEIDLHFTTNEYQRKLYQFQLKIQSQESVSQKYLAIINVKSDQIQELRMKKEQLYAQITQLIQNQRHLKEINERQIKLSQEKSNELLVLKQQFSCYKKEALEKEKQFQRKYFEDIRMTKHQNQVLQNKYNDLKDKDCKIEDALTNAKLLAIKFKKHNQYLATDMHRINEELYQHWLALKEIKDLTTRNNNFDKIKKVYENLLFNDELFL